MPAKATRPSLWSTVLNPAWDLDLTTNTDLEDTMAFCSDVAEFATQDFTFAADILSQGLYAPVGFSLGYGVMAYGVAPLGRRVLSFLRARL